MITPEEVISLGVLRRPQIKDLPDFVFAMRDGLLVPFRCEDAVNLIGEEVFVLRKDIQDEEDGLLTWQDLVGYTVEDNGTTVGVISYVDEQTINTLATLEDGRMMPLHEDFILEIDTDAHILRVNLPFVL